MDYACSIFLNPPNTLPNKPLDNSLSIPGTGAHNAANVHGSSESNLNHSTMNYSIDIQQACLEDIPVSHDVLTNWAIQTLTPLINTAELTLRFVDRQEITHLNHQYRKMNKATNVLAFPASYPEEIELDVPLLGDVVICPEILLEESQSLNKPLIAHWAHIVIHGILHLLGYDHIDENDAKIMQALEIQLLERLGFDDPYDPIETEAH